MSIEKSQLKIQLAEEFRAGFGDALSAAKDDTLRWDGSKVALKGAVKAIETLLVHIQKDHQEELLTLDGAKVARLYVKRAAESCRNLLLAAEVNEQRAKGRMDAMNSAMLTADKVAKMEQHKIDALNDTSVGGRPVGRHPGDSLADKRRVEAAITGNDEKDTIRKKRTRKKAKR